MRLFILVGILCLLLSFLAARVAADSTGSSADVNNAGPKVDSVNVALSSGGVDQASFSPLENDQRSIYIHGTATDNNGCGDISATGQWGLVLHRSGVAPTCSADNNNCYIATSMTQLTLTGCTGGADLNLNYEFVIDVEHFIDPTDAGAPYEAEDWEAAVTVEDRSHVRGNRSDRVEVNSLLAFDVSASVNYGTIALGADSDQETITFTSTGNRAVDASQTATSGDSGNMVCNGQGSQNIAVGNVHISLSDGFAYGDGQALTAGASVFNLSLAKRTGDAVSTKDTYLLLRMPSSGIGGSCSNTVTFSATADS